LKTVPKIGYNMPMSKKEGIAIMIKLEQKAKILKGYYIEGKSQRKISKELDISRTTVKKYINEFKYKYKEIEKLSSKNGDREKILKLIGKVIQKPKYNSSSRSKIKLTEDVIEIIDDLKKKKQLIKKADIHKYLNRKGYEIGYTTVCNHIKETYEGKETDINQGCQIEQAVKKIKDKTEKEAAADLIRLSFYYGFLNNIREKEKIQIERGLELANRKIFPFETKFNSPEDLKEHIERELKRLDLIHGDCIEEMDNLIRQGVKVDAVITDPPYNISKDNNFSTMGRAGLDFGEWDKGFDLYSYIDKVYKILDKNGTFIVFCDWKKISDIVKYSEKLGFTTKDMLRIEKTNPMPRNRNRRYVTDYECAIWFVKQNGVWVFNRQSDTYERPKYVGVVEKGYHPTQKNKYLMEKIISVHTNEGQTVLDPFMGSGTTGVAARKLKRGFIGIEKEEKFYNIAKERLCKNEKIYKE
jgi:site-specific DNA-methyltransferase (adenine-specific)/modification methylase